jgi:SAM-dependent MidA family methyltransferase
MVAVGIELPARRIVTLIEHLREKAAAAGGFLPFEEFMRACLYHPAFGYYVVQAHDVGKRGDFSTCSTLHAALGECIARWALQSGFRDWIEIGAGSGELASAIIKAIPFWRRSGIRYRIVEVSRALRDRQRKRLGSRRISWHETVREALNAATGKGLVFSNELVDAFPCAVIEWTQEGWKEVGLAVDKSSSAEVLRVVRSRLRPYLPNPWEGIRCGQRCEVHASYREWLFDWLPELHSGHLLTIDYGDTFPQLYLRHPGGTLRAYFRHNRIEGAEIYQRAGRQDITADVNFSDLREWGGEGGLEELGFATQRDFMLRIKPGLEARAEKDSALRFVLDSDGAGTAYRILWQARTAESPASG